MSGEQNLVIDHAQGLITVTLDRPRALNALTTDMVAGIGAVVDASSAPVLIRSENPVAFCAGGDIRAIREYAIRGDREAIREFFATEYAMNLAVAQTPHVVSVVDGICLGGGLGIAGHSRVHVVTERASLGMPETAIGFFPDVGASHLLAAAPGEVGLYLAMTGARLGPADAIYAGLATHLIASADLPEFGTRLRTEGITAALESAALPVDVADCALLAHRDDIDRCFSAESVPAVLERVAATDNDWGVTTSALLRAASPQSLATAFALVRRARTSTLADCLDRDLAVALAMVHTDDFIEGVGAKLVDRNRAPVWTSRHDSVDPAMSEVLL